ncbi:hypothetical protein ES703_75993 [subsurface metagenome]
MKGQLSGEEDLVIEGRFQGKIDLANNNILVSEGGNVEAEIRVNNISIKGSVTGNVIASGKVFISEEGQLKGDISAPTISIMDGARFLGSVKMGKEIERVSPPKKETGDLFDKEHAAEEEKETEIREDTEDGSPPKFSDF